jgi:hypothetical protein
VRRFNLLRAHGSPTGYLYKMYGCRCSSCRGAQADRKRLAYWSDPEKHRARSRRYRQEHLDQERERERRYSARKRVENPEKRRLSDRVGYANNRDKYKAQRLQRRYGISPQERDAILAMQSGLCPICGVDIRGREHVDHDHVTGAVRGLLCQLCNLGLGAFRDDPKRLSAAMSYLEARA